MKKDTVILSADGSNTIISKRFGVSYHSIHGALEESIHVFISAGIYNQVLKAKKELKIFEMGFGTGLNAWLSCLEAINLNIKVDYTGIELYPLDPMLANQLNYGKLLKIDEENQNLFRHFHELDWNTTHQINPQFSLTKIESDILTHKLPQNKYDLIYFDAFAPSSQSYLWEKNLHERLFKSLKPAGALVTYCAKGVFKRMLKDIGYTLEPLNGPARKHEMTRAVKP